MKNVILTMVMAAFSVMSFSQNPIELNVDSIYGNEVTFSFYYPDVYYPDSLEWESAYLTVCLDSSMTESCDSFYVELSSENLTANFDYETTYYAHFALSVIDSSLTDTLMYPIWLYSDVVNFTTLGDSTINDTTMSIYSIVNTEKYLSRVYDLTGRMVYQAPENRVKYNDVFNYFSGKGIFIFLYNDGTFDKRYLN